MRYLYLHGFASGPQSRKAQAFRTALASRGVEVEIPDLAAGDFEHLTISGQLAVVERTLLGEPANLIGSSMGGYVAALYAASHPEVGRLVLLAPAFGFAPRWEALIGAQKLAAWRESGWFDVFHYGDKANRLVHYGLYEDALRHAPNPAFTQPARIYQGVHDETVPIELSRAFAACHPNAGLQEFDSDHELLNVLDIITADAVPFLTTMQPQLQVAQAVSPAFPRTQYTSLNHMSKLKPGDPAPDFELPDQHGAIVRLSQFRQSSAVVLFFYPKDDTTGCTKEACAFRDQLQKFAAAGAQVLGISSDSIASHERFATKYGLPFTLLSDRGGRIRKLYGVKRTFGILPGRVTFVIGKDGLLKHIFDSQSQPERHVEEALAALA